MVQLAGKVLARPRVAPFNFREPQTEPEQVVTLCRCYPRHRRKRAPRGKHYSRDHICAPTDPDNQWRKKTLIWRAVLKSESATASARPNLAVDACCNRRAARSTPISEAESRGDAGKWQQCAAAGPYACVCRTTLE